MNGFVKRLPLQTKLLLIAIVPILFIGFLTIRLYNEKTKNLEVINSYLTRMRHSAVITRLIDQLQMERGLSFDYVLQPTNPQALLAQRLATDSSLKQLEAIHDRSLDSFTKYTFLESLDSIRRLINSNKYSTTEVMYFFSNSIFRLNTLNRHPVIRIRPLEDASNEMVAQRLLSELVTYQGIITANIYNVLFTKKYIPETLFGTRGTYQVYLSYKKELEVKSAGSAKKIVDSLRRLSSNKKVDDYLKKVFTTFQTDSTYSYSEWRQVAEESLNEIRTTQLKMLKKAEDMVSDFYENEKVSRTRTIVYLLIVSALLVLVLSYILSTINQSLKSLKNAALKIAYGATGINVKPESKDAIGSLALSIKKVDEKNQELTLAAKQIGEGNFSVNVQPRSDEDILGTAIFQMKEKLLRSTTELKNSREQFKQLADFMPQIVWTASADGSTDYYNNKWYEITGAKARGDQSWIPVLHPDDVGPCLTTWHRSVETGEPYEIEYRFKDVRTNSFRWFLGRALPVKDDSGTIIKWFGTATDIHDQKMQKEKLEELVAQRTTDLKRSNEDLQQFAHVASHDLKEPVRKIRIFTQRLGDEYGNLVPEKGRTYIDKLQASSERISNMIDSILKYSVVNATEDKLEPVDMNLMMEGIVNDLELVIMQKEATINYASLPTLKAIPALMYQLLYNLIANALKFSKENIPVVINVTVQTVSAAEIENAADIPRAKEYIKIIVSDNGIGFNQEFADKLFNVFTRLNPREKYDGTGLGLALCKKIVHRHNGIIYAKGEEGVGSSFHVILPKK